MRGALITAVSCFVLLGNDAAAQSAADAGQGGAPRAAADLVSGGIARAKSEHKLVLVDFGASWCGWCHKFDKFLADTGAAGRTMRDNFIIVPLVVFEGPIGVKARDNPGSDTLLTHYRGNAPDGGIPFFAILDADGSLLGTSNSMPDRSNMGHPDKPEEIDAFDRLLARVAPRITVEQRREIHLHLESMRAKG